MLAALVALVFAVAGRAAAIERNLGEGLVYFRLHAVPADLPDEHAAQKHPLVLDLRFATSDAAGATVLDSWLKFHANARTPIFILVNSHTAPALIAMLRDHDKVAGLLTIGIAGQRFAPDIAVDASSHEERRAYDALESGSTIAALTTDNPDKQRNDEASLEHERQPEPASDGDDAVEAETPPPHPKVLIDAALQRAIQVYRGLKAMKAA